MLKVFEVIWLTGYHRPKKYAMSLVVKKRKKSAKLSDEIVANRIKNGLVKKSPNQKFINQRPKDKFGFNLSVI